MFKVPEKHRITTGLMATTAADGRNGAFKIPFSHRSFAYVVASDGMGWEHVSVHVVSDGRETTPTWAAMCKIKDTFWDEEDCVVQYHPPKSDYVNNHKFTLHLWRPTDQPLPRPDSILVGFK